jgi:hypothetical protein
MNHTFTLPNSVDSYRSPMTELLGNAMRSLRKTLSEGKTAILTIDGKEVARFEPPAIEACACGRNAVFIVKSNAVVCLCGRKGPCMAHKDDPKPEAIAAWNADQRAIKTASRLERHPASECPICGDNAMTCRHPLIDIVRAHFGAK